jgi:hypothetical protein
MAEISEFTLGNMPTPDYISECVFGDVTRFYVVTLNGKKHLAIEQGGSRVELRRDQIEKMPMLLEKWTEIE